MDPDRFRQALRDLAPPGDSLIELVEGWNIQLLAAIDEIAPRRPLRPRRNRAPWFTEELRKMKRDLRRLEREMEMGNKSPCGLMGTAGMAALYIL
ncbi:Hypothetical predicted protein, partial [Podarcis lilfordi]